LDKVYTIPRYTQKMLKKINFVNIYTFVHAHNQSVLMASRKDYKAVFIYIILIKFG
jgi:hypothetical protein